MRSAVLLMIGLGLGLFIVGVGFRPAHSHQANSGWAYPTSCCSSHDCRVISEKDLAFDGDVITVKLTGEKFFMPGTAKLHPDVYAREAKWSGDPEHPDQDYHRCSAQYPEKEDGYTYCVFLPPGLM